MLIAILRASSAVSTLSPAKAKVRRIVRKGLSETPASTDTDLNHLVRERWAQSRPPPGTTPPGRRLQWRRHERSFMARHQWQHVDVAHERHDGAMTRDMKCCMLARCFACRRHPSPRATKKTGHDRYCCKSLRAGWVRFFPGRGGALRKKHVGVHSTDRSRHQGLPQPHYNAIEQRLLVAPALTSIFDTPNFSTFATISTRTGHRRPKFFALRNSYSITSWAVASSVSGKVRPSAFAVFWLMISSILVDICTGRSAGFSPCRMRAV
jgi:hypothetical protein